MQDALKLMEEMAKEGFHVDLSFEPGDDWTCSGWHPSWSGKMETVYARTDNPRSAISKVHAMVMKEVGK